MLINKKKKEEFKSSKEILLSTIFHDQRLKAAKYVHHEFQDFGYRLAVQLGDVGHKSLYIRLAKKEPREMLLAALSFAKDYPRAKNKGKIFMWKLKGLRQERKQKLKQEPAQAELPL